MSMPVEPIRLTQYSHGAGCGCKISPAILDQILSSSLAMPDNDRLLVGNHSRDDAAVYKLNEHEALISTTDFFMPIVDDPFQFGRIASANAISDVYAMGGRPVLAIAILGWPINTLSPEVARQVIEGSRSICKEAGIPLAGGHSIDSPEPIFGLAVNGLVAISNLKQNNTAQAGDVLLLTKPIGIGILTTAEKKGRLQPAHTGLAAATMMQLNLAGTWLGEQETVHALTDVTGFGLLGHLSEMAEGSGLTAELWANQVPLLTPELSNYIEAGCVPGGTNRNLASYGHLIAGRTPQLDALLADPQTSGGLLIAVSAKAWESVAQSLTELIPGYQATPIGQFTERKTAAVIISESR